MLFGPIAPKNPGSPRFKRRPWMKMLVTSETGIWSSSRHTTRQIAVTTNALRSINQSSRVTVNEV